MEETLKLILDKLEHMATKEDIAATNARLDAMQSDIAQIKEDTAITRETVNGLGEWTEIASDVLKIKYPVQK